MDEVVLFISLFSALSFVVWTIVNFWIRRAHLRAVTDFNLRLLDRVGSIKDFNEFLQTDGGVKFMSSLTASTTVRQGGSPGSRILFASQAGIVLSALGVGLLTLQARLVDEQGAVGFVITGVIALSIGVGFLLSAAASWWLARSLGVLDDLPPMPSRREAA